MLDRTLRQVLMPIRKLGIYRGEHCRNYLIFIQNLVRKHKKHNRYPPQKSLPKSSRKLKAKL